jgi:CRP/FNR family transcriptional regulator, cyclic AMP receptor protein
VTSAHKDRELLWGAKVTRYLLVPGGLRFSIWPRLRERASRSRFAAAFGVALRSVRIGGRSGTFATRATRHDTAPKASPDWLGERFGESPLLSCVGQQDLIRLARRAIQIVYREGEAVVVEGEGGAGFYVILDGSASVAVEGHLQRGLGPGDSFGELSIISGRARSATVVAATDLHCAVFTPWEFRALLEEHPCVAAALRRQIARYLEPATSGQGAVRRWDG